MSEHGRFNQELILGRFGHGWLRDEPDPEDYDSEDPEVAHLFAALEIDGETEVPSSIDHRRWAGPVRSQGAANACTAFAVCSLVEFLEHRAFGKIEPQAPRFLYRVTCNLLGRDTSHGAHTRSALGALATIGSIPERYWPWDDDAVEDEPTAFCYAVASNRRAVSYVRIDHPDVVDAEVIVQARRLLAAGLPLITGFTLFADPVQQSVAAGGAIPLPTVDDAKLGGHCVVVVGYDDHKVVTSTADAGTATKGAFLVQNSWGDSWGEAGFGWLPYTYVEIGQSVDWWVLLGEHWLDTDRFGF